MPADHEWLIFEQHNQCLEMGILYGFRSLTCKKTGNMLYNDPNGVVGVKVYYATAFQALMQWILSESSLNSL